MSTNPRDFNIVSGIPTSSSGTIIRTDLTGSYAEAVSDAFAAEGGLLSQGIPANISNVVVVGYFGTDPGGFNPNGQHAYNGSLINITTNKINDHLVNTAGTEWIYVRLGDNNGVYDVPSERLAQTILHEGNHFSTLVDARVRHEINWVLANTSQGALIHSMGRSAEANFIQGFSPFVEHLLIGRLGEVYNANDPASFSVSGRNFQFYLPSAQAALAYFAVNGHWSGISVANGVTETPVDLEVVERSQIEVLDRFDNGGVAAYVNQNGQIVVTDEDSRYTENMLNNYGTEHVNSDGDLEGGMTFGATMRAFADWIGLDGTLGIQDSFAHDDEGSAAAGTVTDGVGGDSGSQTSGTNNSTNSDSNNDSSGNGFVDAVNAVGAALVHGFNSVGDFLGFDGTPGFQGTYNQTPILLDLDGNGIQLTDLTRSTVFMEGEEGLEHRTAWAGAGDGVLFYDTDGEHKISDIREYVFTEWDPTATDDLAALRSRFDSNGDGKLTGTELTGFKVMKTNADGSLSAVTLARLGITQINHEMRRTLRQNYC